MSTGTSIRARIRTDLERQILSGALRPDDRIPVEHELMAAYDCSRMTVNQAVGDLVHKGLVVRRKRAGSFVAHPPNDSTILGIPDIQSDLASRGVAYDFAMLRRVVRAPRKTLPAETDLAGAGRLLSLTSLHRADGQPFAHERRLISLAAVPDAETADFTETPPGSWLLHHVPWSQAEHRIFAVAADAAVAEVLAIGVGEPCLLLERRTWLDGTPVTHVWQTFPGDRHSFVGAFSHGSE